MVFDWPPRELSSNYSGHWASSHRAKQKYKGDCYYIAKSYDVPDLGTGDITLEVTFYPPNAKIDRANMPHLFKYGFDGIALAWSVNDKRFNPVYKYEEPIKGGKVSVIVRKNNA